MTTRMKVKNDNDIFAAEELVVTKNKVIRKISDLARVELSQLSFLISCASNKLLAFGNRHYIKTVEDCFKKRNVDDGVVVYKEMRRVDGNQGEENDEDDGNVLHYWVGYFGGNPTGYLLCKRNELDCHDNDDALLSASAWTVVMQNCDGDFIWQGNRQLPAPKTFIKAVKRAVYGDKYNEEEDV